MELKCEEEMVGLIAGCLPELSEIEAAYLQQRYLDEPKSSLSEFAQRWQLTKKTMDELRGRVAVRLRELLARKQIYSMKDII